MQQLLFQLENTLFGALIIMISILISGEKDRWYKIIDENSPFRNKYFLAYMITLWIFGCPFIGWYFQINPHGGIWEPLYKMGSTVAWSVRIASVILVIVCLRYFKKRKNVAP